LIKIRVFFMHSLFQTYVILNIFKENLFGTKSPAVNGRTIINIIFET